MNNQRSVGLRFCNRCKREPLVFHKTFFEQMKRFDVFEPCKCETPIAVLVPFKITIHDNTLTPEVL